MAAAADRDLQALFAEFLDVCNAAIEANRDQFPYQQVLAATEEFFADRIVEVRIYEQDPDEPLETHLIRLHEGALEILDGKRSVKQGQEPSFHISIRKKYLHEVVQNREEYIQHPERLDLDWLKSRLGFGGVSIHSPRRPSQ